MNNSFWLDRRVFVTGVNGFLGSWLAAALVENGAEVIGLIRDKVPQSQLVRSGTIKKISVVEGDICDYALLERVLAEYEINTIIHLAAQTIVGIANRVPLSTFETNIKGTWSLLEAARRNPTVKRIVVASSDKAYGYQEQLPYREDSPLMGRHPYDVSKSCADLIAQSYAHSYEMPISVTRFANLFGGGDLNWNRLIPGTIRSVLREERPVIRGDGTFSRDYLYIADAVRGYLLTAEGLDREDVRGQTFNFGVDRPVTVMEMVQTIIDVSGCSDLEPIVLDEVKNEIPDQYLASTKVQKILGWEPDFTLEQGLRMTLDWYRDFLLAG